MLQGYDKRVIVEYGLKLGGDKVEDIVSLRISFESGIDEKLEGGYTVSGINNGNRQGPEGEWLGSIYVSGERAILGESALGMSLGTKMGAEVLSRRVPTDVF